MLGRKWPFILSSMESYTIWYYVINYYFINGQIMPVGNTDTWILWILCLVNLCRYFSCYLAVIAGRVYSMINLLFISLFNADINMVLLLKILFQYFLERQCLIQCVRRIFFNACKLMPDLLPLNSFFFSFPCLSTISSLI